MLAGADQLEPLLAAGVFVCAGLGGALLFRLGRVAGGRPSAAVLGGLLAGFLLGPAVLGVADPELQQRLTVGAVDERAEMDTLLRQHEADKAALRASGVSQDAFGELDMQHEDEARGPRIALANAETAHRRGVSGALVVLVSLGIGMGWASAPRAMVSLWPGRATGVVAASLMSAAVATIATALMAQWLLGIDRATAIVAGCAFGAGPIASALPARWAPNAGRSGAVGWFGAAGTLAVGAVLAWLAPDAAMLCVVPIGAAALGVALRTTGVFGRRMRNAARLVLLYLAVPALAAWLVASTDPVAAARQPGGVFFIAACLLLAGDAALIGAWLGFKWLGAAQDHRNALSVALECVSAGLAPASLCFMGALVGAGWVEPRAAGAALVLGLVGGLAMVEALVGPNRKAKGGFAGGQPDSD